MTTETKRVWMPRELTAENGAKGALMGEFSVAYPDHCPDCSVNSGISEDTICETCGDSGTVVRHVNVPWITIKAIYAKAVEHFATMAPSS